MTRPIEPDNLMHPIFFGVSASLVFSGLVGFLLPTNSVLAFSLALLPFCLLLLLQLQPQLCDLIRFALKWRWWQTLWFLLWASGLVLRIRTTSGISENPLDIAALYRMALVGLAGGLILWAGLSNQEDLFSQIGRGLYLPLLAFNIINVLSTLWSSQPAWTLYRSVEFAIDSLIIAAIASRLTESRQLKALFDWTWVLSGISLLFVVANLVIYPDQAITPIRSVFGFGIQSVYPAISRNSIGQISGILLIVAFTRVLSGHKNKLAFTLLGSVSLVLLVLSQTRSTIVPVAFAIPVVLFLLKRYWLLLFSLTPLPILLLTADIPRTVSAYFIRGETTSEILSLTGRTNWWDVAIAQWQEQPYLGFGAFTGGRFIVGEEFSDTLSSSHNSYIEILLGTGLLGLIPFVVLIIGVWASLARAVMTREDRILRTPLERMLAVEAIAVLIILMVRSVLSVAMIWHPPIDFLIIVAYANFLLQRQSTSHRSTDVVQVVNSPTDAHPSHP